LSFGQLILAIHNSLQPVLD